LDVDADAIWDLLTCSADLTHSGRSAAVRNKRGLRYKCQIDGCVGKHNAPYAGYL